MNLLASHYKDCLLAELRSNFEHANILNSIFFPENSNIIEWLEWTEVKSFHDYEFKGDVFVNRNCTREEIDLIPLINGSEKMARYTIFASAKYKTYEAAVNEFPGFYHFVNKRFDQIIDQAIFDRLHDYKTETKNPYTYSKRILNLKKFVLKTERDFLDINGIIGYTFPTFLINIAGDSYFKFGTIDVRNLLFLPSSSFTFFYSDSHNYTINKDTRLIQKITRKEDEPVIYYLSESEEYLVTNSWENIDRYNKYIQIILELSVYYFRFFEKWVLNSINNTLGCAE